MARKTRQRRSASAGQVVEQPAPKHIQVTGKRVQGDDGRKHLKGERLLVGQDVSVETAMKMVQFGTATVIDGERLEATAQQVRDQEAAKLMHLHKQRADDLMEQFDRQSPETREELRETNGEVLDDGQ